jgi:hypothetical protein
MEKGRMGKILFGIDWHVGDKEAAVNLFSYGRGEDVVGRKRFGQ